MSYMYFDKKDVEKGLHLDFIKALLDYSAKSSDRYIDIHVKPEDDAIVVEFINNSYDYKKAEFVEVDEDHAVLKEVIFPDNSSQYMFDEEECDALHLWDNEHPDFYKK